MMWPYLRRMCLSLLLGGISYGSGVFIDPRCCSLFSFFIIFMCSIYYRREDLKRIIIELHFWQCLFHICRCSDVGYCSGLDINFPSQVSVLTWFPGDGTSLEGGAKWHQMVPGEWALGFVAQPHFLSPLYFLMWGGVACHIVGAHLYPTVYGTPDAVPPPT